MIYFLSEFGLLPWELKKWPLRNEVSWHSTADEFLDLPRHILEFATTENHKREISVAVEFRKEGEGANAVKNSGYFPACSAVVMLKIETLNETYLEVEV